MNGASALIYPFPPATESAGLLCDWAEQARRTGMTKGMIEKFITARVMQEPRIFSPTGLDNWQLAHGEFSEHARVIYLDALISRKKA